ncbi:MAG TPA: choice-of-anchor D domain-containing protein [archaeon]|nr:choice-of-anchor D domain-containing protein [archaeon]
MDNIKILIQSLFLLLLSTPVLAVPVLEYSPKDLDFGMVQVGQPAVRYFSVYNRGTTDLIISGLSWGGWGPLDSLVFEPNEGVIKPGDSLNVKCIRICWQAKSGNDRIGILTNITPDSWQAGPAYVFSVTGGQPLTCIPDTIPLSTRIQKVTIKGTVLNVLAFNPITISYPDYLEMEVLERSVDSVVVSLKCLSEAPLIRYQIRFHKNNEQVEGIFFQLAAAVPELRSISPRIWQVPSAADTFLVLGKDFFSSTTFSFSDENIKVLQSILLSDSLASLVASVERGIYEGLYSLIASNGVNTATLDSALRLEYEPVRLSIDTLDLGSLLADSELRRKITVYNNTDTTITVDTVFSSDSRILAVASSAAGTRVLPPFNAFEVELAIAPTQAGLYRESVSVVCGEDTARAFVTADVKEEAVPELMVEPTAIDLPRGFVDSVFEAGIFVFNTGTGELSFEISAEYQSGDFSALPESGSLVSGDSLKVLLQCTPRRAGGDSLTVIIDSNDPACPQKRVTLRLEAIAVELGNGVWKTLWGIAVSTTELYFGEIPLGTSCRKGFVLKNTTDEIATAVVHIAAVDNFKLEPDSLYNPEKKWLELTLQPGEIFQVWVVFTPTEIKYYSEDLNTPAGATMDIIMTGAAVGWRSLGNAPKIEMEKLSLDMGILKTGRISQGAERELLIRNQGSAELRIAGVFTSLPNIGTNIWRESIPPGGSYNMRVSAGSGAEYWYDRVSLIINSNDPVNPRLELELRAFCIDEFRYLQDPLLAVFDSPLDFGILEPGDSSTRSIRIANIGSGLLTLESIAASLPDYIVCTVSESSGAIQPGYYETVRFTVKPSGAGDLNDCCITIKTNDPLRPEYALPARLTCQAGESVSGEQLPAVSIDSATLDFGTIPAGSPVSRTIKISNSGQKKLTVFSIRSPFLSIIPGSAIISPGEEKKVELTFATNTPLEVSDSILITCSDPHAPSQSIPWRVTATGFGTLSSSPDTVSRNSGQQFVAVTGMAYPWWKCGLSVLVKPGWGEAPYWQYYSPPDTINIPLDPPVEALPGQHYIHLYNTLGFRDSVPVFLQTGSPRIRKIWPSGLFPPGKDVRMTLRGDFFLPGINFGFDNDRARVTGVSRVSDTLAVLSVDLDQGLIPGGEVELVAINPDGGRDSAALTVYVPVTACDFNGDGLCYLSDVIALILALRDSPGNLVGDLNSDRLFDIADARDLLNALRHGGCPENRLLLASANDPENNSGPESLAREDLDYVVAILGQLGLTEAEESALGKIMDIVPAIVELPRSFALSQNYPNPFNPSTSISFCVPENAGTVNVLLRVFDLRGAQVRTLAEGERAPGSYTVFWDGRDEQGRMLSSGIYFYRLQAGEFTRIRKMVLLK